jgi:nitrate reductase molybdenum cofactor assembly chaperone NarJ/NarW
MPTAATESKTWESLAGLLYYPQEDYAAAVKNCHNHLLKNHHDAAACISEFMNSADKYTTEELQELYTRTFDIAPICIPYVTAYIYGEESFERGDLMSKLGEIYARYGFQVAGELPDHIAVILGFADLLNEEEKGELIEYCLTNPVNQMVERLQTADNIFAPVLVAVKLVLAKESAQRTTDA